MEAEQDRPKSRESPCSGTDRLARPRRRERTPVGHGNTDLSSESVFARHANGLFRRHAGRTSEFFRRHLKKPKRHADKNTSRHSRYRQCPFRAETNAATDNRPPSRALPVHFEEKNSRFIIMRYRRPATSCLTHRKDYAAQAGFPRRAAGLSFLGAHHKKTHAQTCIFTYFSDNNNITFTFSVCCRVLLWMPPPLFCRF